MHLLVAIFGGMVNNLDLTRRRHLTTRLPESTCARTGTQRACGLAMNVTKNSLVVRCLSLPDLLMQPHFCCSTWMLEPRLGRVRVMRDVGLISGMLLCLVSVKLGRLNLDFFDSGVFLVPACFMTCLRLCSEEWLYALMATVTPWVIRQSLLVS